LLIITNKYIYLHITNSQTQKINAMNTTQKLSKNQMYVIDSLKNQEKGMTYNISGKVCFPAWVKYTNTIKSLINLGLIEVVQYNHYNNKMEYVALTENKKKRQAGEYKIYNKDGSWYHLIVDANGNETTLKSGAEYLEYKINN
jgi:hypothetical protein